MGKAKVEACMICTPDPCECFNSKKKATTQPRKRQPAQGKAAPSEPASEGICGSNGPARADLRAKMKAAAAAAPSTHIKPLERKSYRHTETELTKAAPAPRPILSDEQLLLNAALRALGPLLCEEDHDRYRMIIESTPSDTERKAEWKARRRCLL